jgi:hypothetical protein
MNKCKSSLKDLVKKKKIYKVPDIPLSCTPSIKILNQATTGRSTAPTRDSQSYASSPHTARDDLRSFQASPFSKDVKINTLLKESLKRFKSQKLELAKIKEFAEKWKKSRKKKLQDFNQVTRSENKVKSNSKTTRARTAWESPDRPLETPQMISRQSGPLDRRANIGLEFYNLRSPRNTTPKNLQEARKSAKKKESQPFFKKDEDVRPQGLKRKIADFMKKKRKERIKNQKKVKEFEEENEIKRLAQLMKVERAAKLMVKKKKVLKVKKNKKKDEKKIVKVDKVSDGNSEMNKRESFCYSVDEEVLNIMQVRKLEEVSGEVNTGRQCMIFADMSQTLTADKIDTTEIVKKIIGKHAKSEEISKVISCSMPIIELKSISNESSSNQSEKILLKRVEKMRKRLKSPEILGKPEKNPSRLVHSLQKLLRKRKKRIFLQIRSFKGLSFNFSSENQKQSQFNSLERKQELDEILNKYIQSRETSEDLEKIWEKIEINCKVLENDDLSKTCKPPEEAKLSEGSNMETMKKVLSFESGSFVKPEENDDIDSFLSIVSESSEDQAEHVFFYSSKPLQAVSPQTEPVKMQQDEIFIEEGKSLNEGKSIIEDFSPQKESSFIVTPESEEVEEFSSVNSFKVTSFSVRPFNTRDSSFVLTEEEVVEGAIFYLVNFLFQETLEDEVFEDFKKKNFQLLGNKASVIQDLCFFTSEFGVKQTSKKIWLSINEDLLKNLIFDPSFHLFNLGNFREKLADSEKFLKKTLISFEDSDIGYSRIHNKAIFDLINLYLRKIRIERNPSPWKIGKFFIEKWNFDEIIQDFLKWTQDFCRVCSGKIPTNDMILMDGSLDEDLLQSVREQGLERILFFDIIESEPLWTDYETEEKMMIFDMADMVITDLIEEIESILA